MFKAALVVSKAMYVFFRGLKDTVKPLLAHLCLNEAHWFMQ